MPCLQRHRSDDVTLLGDDTVAAGGVTFAFTERTGGTSAAPYASLNLGDRCGDDPACVERNRALALAAVGAPGLAGRLVVPHQVHGDHVVVVREGEGALDRALDEAHAGADAVVCVAREVPVMLCFADCVPVVLVAPDGFAVVHSGWRGTAARICEKAARVLCREVGCAPDDLLAYVGPHVQACDYEVSQELVDRFVDGFGPGANPSGRLLDLGHCVRAALLAAGVPEASVACCDVSTASATDRFFSYRAEHGRCGRHAAVAVMGAGRPHWEPLAPEGGAGHVR